MANRQTAMANRHMEVMNNSNPEDMANRSRVSMRCMLTSMAALACRREAMEATWAAPMAAGAVAAAAVAHAMVVPEDLASVHHAEATDPASDPLVAAMAAAQATKRSMPAL